ncbi:MAG TPA: 3-phosphoshikimate 1-carboxyvinyltransferase, partial [Flavobacteriales bacterium]|nr:3-phosphoshikimate 1-carboxyvinyltransferase [Flavobacteriales bacterium]
PNTSSSEEDILLNIGESGLGLRMFSGLASLKNQAVTITGKGSILERPIAPVMETLSACDVEVYSKAGKLPITISGKLKGGNYTVDGSFSSQILTGLLISLPLADGDTKLHVKNLKSIPYIDMTLELVQLFGAEITHDDYKTFHIKGNQSYDGTSYAVEGDWSGMANHVVGAAISGSATILGLNEHSLQADKAILTALERTGASVDWNNGSITVKQVQNLPFELDATHSPDIFPPLVVLACAAEGVSRITGIHRLMHKESDRLAALIETFGKLRVTLTTEGDTLLVHGTGRVSAGTIHSFNDHRIAMAGCIAACISDGPIQIEKSDAVKKSYPLFFEELDEFLQE